jgi:CBS domain containing-hemolysin-like protein
MLRIAPLLFGFYKLLSWCGAIDLFKYVSRALAKITRTRLPSRTMISTVQRHETAAFFRDIHEESFLSTIQADILNRLVAASNITVKEVIIPFKKVQLVEINSNRQALLNTLTKSSFTRLLVYDNIPDKIIGFINIYEVLSSKKKVASLHHFTKPIRKISDDVQVMDAIEIMQKEKEKIILVVHNTRSKKQITVGIITMKDLVEELFGELTVW